MNPHFQRVLTLLILAAAVCVAQTDHADAFTGVWKLNAAKSQYSQGSAPSSETVTIMPDGRTTLEASSSGQTSRWSYPLSAGKEVPVEGIEHATVIEKRSGRTSDYTMKIGAVTITAHIVISEDGRTLTRTFDASDRQGHNMHGIAVYEKE